MKHWGCTVVAWTAFLPYFLHYISKVPNALKKNGRKEQPLDWPSSAVFDVDFFVATLAAAFVYRRDAKASDLVKNIKIIWKGPASDGTQIQASPMCAASPVTRTPTSIVVKKSMASLRSRGVTRLLDLTGGQAPTIGKRGARGGRKNVRRKQEDTQPPLQREIVPMVHHTRLAGHQATLPNSRRTLADDLRVPHPCGPWPESMELKGP